MDLTSGYPYWPIRNGLMHIFPPLEEDVRCDILVVGAGITGALLARALALADLDVVVVDERDIGWGSTAASTALIQFEIDTHLTALQEQYGANAAAMAYLACRDAVFELRDISAEIGDIDFAMTDSLYVASRPRDRVMLEKECQARRQIGFDIHWLTRREIAQIYGVLAHGGILNVPSARLDPYRFTSRLLQRLTKAGTRIYDRTAVTSWHAGSRGILATTRTGATIRSRYLLLAAGYASQHYLRRRVARNHSTYAWITDILKPNAMGPWSRTLLWESARPYVYMRPTSDGRLIVGGEDDRIDIPARRDRRIEKKVAALEKGLRRLVPALAVQPAFAWAGTFAETADGLPYFGPEPGQSTRVLFAMAYGGNGITYSAIGARLLADRVRGRSPSPLSAFFSFERRPARQR